ncbi:hypothetical protein [Streptomyces eurythermus]|uniref:hypothetical protein n=1 Tax=Streptomyces eurythermus TaxID=42237 RepID=UPI0033D76290
MVDVVCCEDERYVCGVWAYGKRDTASGRRVHDRNILLDPCQDPVPELVEYVGTVLEATAPEPTRPP